MVYLHVDRLRDWSMGAGAVVMAVQFHCGILLRISVTSLHSGSLTYSTHQVEGMQYRDHDKNNGDGWLVGMGKLDSSGG